ncbi:hypothetical protein Tco_1377734 [Tanacetum coccineum]
MLIPKREGRFVNLVEAWESREKGQYKKIKRYVRGLLERIQGNVNSSRPANVHEAICMAHELVDKSVQAKVTRVNKSNKRRWEDQQRNNNNNCNNIENVCCDAMLVKTVIV